MHIYQLLIVTFLFESPENFTHALRYNNTGTGYVDPDMFSYKDKIKIESWLDMGLSIDEISEIISCRPLETWMLIRFSKLILNEVVCWLNTSRVAIISALLSDCYLPDMIAKKLKIPENELLVMIGNNEILMNAYRSTQQANLMSINKRRLMAVVEENWPCYKNSFDSIAPDVISWINERDGSWLHGYKDFLSHKHTSHTLEFIHWFELESHSKKKLDEIINNRRIDE